LFLICLVVCCCKMKRLFSLFFSQNETEVYIFYLIGFIELNLIYNFASIFAKKIFTRLMNAFIVSKLFLRRFWPMTPHPPPLSFFFFFANQLNLILLWKFKLLHLVLNQRRRWPSHVTPNNTILFGRL
jgi:hypothetical protein